MIPKGQLELTVLSMEGIITKTERQRSATDRDSMNLFALLLSNFFSEISDRMTLNKKFNLKLNIICLTLSSSTQHIQWSP